MPRFLLLARIILKNNANALLQLDKSKRKNKEVKTTTTNELKIIIPNFIYFFINLTS